jgi:transcription elongation factor Elf1
MKRYKHWFKCARCPAERDRGYEIASGVVLCKRCYNRWKREVNEK